MDLEKTVRSAIDRERILFDRDLRRSEAGISAEIRRSSFLVMGGAGSIGQEVVKAIFSRGPRKLHVVDLSENNLVELVRDIRSSYGYIEGNFATLPLDCGGIELEALLAQNEPYDYVLNLMAMKHVRSEKDAFSLMRMVQTNVLYTERTLRHAITQGSRRYFAVSSDKAVNPANAMGATKRVMELCLVRASEEIGVTSARFANVAFSDGSLLHGFGLRLAKRQPLAAPEDVQRYFITPTEAGVLCLLAALSGSNREAFFPNPPSDFAPQSFRTVAERFLAARNLRPYPCDSEEEARRRVDELSARGLWPCYFFSSDTTGEKPLEEFYSSDESIDTERFQEIGVIRWEPLSNAQHLDSFLQEIEDMRRRRLWTRESILEQLRQLLPDFDHLETGKFLDGKM